MSDVEIAVGVDPGLGGAFALLERKGSGQPRRAGWEFHSVYSMPTEEKKSGRRQVCTGQVYETLRQVLEGREARFIIEQVSAMPGQGVSGMFSLGDSFGTMRAMGECFSPWPVVLCSPVKWKGALNLIKKQKSASLTLARRLYPEARPYLFRKKDEGRAEALLIAHYAAKHLEW
jgi:crossover junction endodeoxyribonuclease RuvC